MKRPAHQELVFLFQPVHHTDPAATRGASVKGIKKKKKRLQISCVFSDRNEAVTQNRLIHYNQVTKANDQGRSVVGKHQ